jgi:hypothetical protein
MQILGLMADKSGYRGFVQDRDQYIYFRASSKQIRKLQAYDTVAFTNHDHFIGLMSRFFPLTGFLPNPLPIDSLSMGELDRIFDHACK